MLTKKYAWQEVEKEEVQPELDVEAGWKYRRAVARHNCLSQDRPDVAIASCVPARAMARGRGTPEELVALSARARPLCVACASSGSRRPEGSLRLATVMGAGDKATRKSTIGAMVMHGIRFMCFASRLQKVVALSLGQAELKAHFHGLCEGLGVATLCEEWRLLCGAVRGMPPLLARGS